MEYTPPKVGINNCPLRNEKNDCCSLNWNFKDFSCGEVCKALYSAYLFGYESANKNLKPKEESVQEQAMKVLNSWLKN